MERVTFSGLDRVIDCPGSVSLRQFKRLSAPASSGTRWHRYMEIGLRQTAQQALEELAALGAEPAEITMAENFAARLDELRLGLNSGALSLAVEEAVAYRWATSEARSLGRSLGRAYEIEEGAEIPGTADLVVVQPAGDGALTLQVFDWKTGRSWRGRARDSWQLRGYALAYARLYTTQEAVVESVTASFAYPTDDGDLVSDEVHWDALDLDGFAATIQQAMLRATSGHPRYIVEGPSCRYCPAFAGCPAKAALAREMADPVGVEKALMTAAAERPGEVWTRLQRAKEVLRRVEDYLCGLGRQQPFETATGIVREVQGKPREEFDGRVVHAVVAARYGRELADEAVELSATKTGIEKALKSTGRGYTARVEEVYAEVRKLGGAHLKPVEAKVKEVPMKGLSS